ncbi:hypothetical protein A0256_10525 [Mucilaginibacter sp. PAMC 26640]|nr:hypothetical protein A0256_10525 [Mucilaginibacter sp. PAMC 26640]
MSKRSVLLLATNKQDYLQFALNCAQSIQLHNPGLPVYIATNIAPAATYPSVQFIPVPAEIAKLFIETKLYLDTFLQTEETLFIDSDCLVYADLSPLFDECKNSDVTVIGRAIPVEDYWSPNPEFARKEFSIDQSIIFNGGFYFIKKTDLTKRIFARAREISERYDEYGFHRIKNKWKNEENLLGIAMNANKQLPIKDDGTFMADFTTDRRPRTLNVLTGARVIRNPGAGNVSRSWYPATYSPVIIHFGGSNLKTYPYLSQSMLLKLARTGVPVTVAGVIVSLFIHFPYKTYHRIKRILGAK